MSVNFKKLLLASVISVAGGQAFATPVINPDYESDVNVPSSHVDSTRWFHGASSTDIYIAPPEKGAVSLTSYAPQNPSYCTDLAIVRASEQNANTMLVLLSEQLFANMVDYGLYEFELDDSGRPVIENNLPVFRLDNNGLKIPTDFKVEIDTAGAQVSHTKAVMDIAKRAVKDAEDNERAAENAQIDAKDDFYQCREDADYRGVDWRDYCSLEYEDYKFARDEYTLARNVLRDTQDSFYDAEYEYETADGILDGFEDELLENAGRIQSMRMLVTQEKVFLAGMYKEIAGIYGGQLNMEYQTLWGDEIAAFAALNPGKNIRRVDVYNPVISIGTSPEILVNSPGLASAPGLAWTYLNIGGIGARHDFEDMPDGLGEGPEDNVLNGWSDSFTGQTGLLLRSSCTMIEGTDGLPQDEKFAVYANNFSEYLAPKIAYSFDVRANASYEATYNRSEFLKVVKKVTQSRGFFNSSSKNEVTEEFKDSRAFEMTFTADAVNDKLSDDDKKALTEVVRARLLTDVLDAVGRRGMVEDPNLDFVPVPESYTVQLSNQLQRTCLFGWGYRCWGGWFFYGIGSIWGGSSTAMTSYEQSHDYESSETVTDYFFINYDYAINFPPERSE
ncbi:hypothetical protein [uncultured Shewanella sp.]|uniref:hypothetical protein n=1 Tax=uncultured Shewanella sp. TaxID=173975 RepID=UPI00261945C1|nr:hypothetical protein [uncultured Shewanella sp.]